MNPRSIRFRLIGWHAGMLSAVFVLLGALMFFGLKQFLEANLSDSQARRARQIADSLLKDITRTGNAYVVTEIQTLYAPEANDRFIRVTQQDGGVVYVSGPPKDQSFDPGALPAPVAWPKKESARRQNLPGGGELLIAALNYAPATGGPYLVEVGAPTTSIRTMLDRLLLLLAIGLPVVVLAGVGGGYLLVGRALGPVDEIARKAEQITQHNLGERLPVARTGDELERLSLSLNRMITRLEDAFQNSKRFVADASHELRTPLTVLRGELEGIVQNRSLPPQLQDTLGSVLEEVERLAKIVERLFALSRLDAGEAQTEWVPFDLAELATTTAGQMNLLAEDKGISISCAAAQQVMVEGDRSRLKQVVVNLLDNAIKYTPERGTVALRVTATEGLAWLEVADNGIGIPTEALPNVFDRFFRVDKARSRDLGGAGLGLSIVKSICAAHGARVEVESALGGGSRFRVALPLANGKSAKPAFNHEK